MVTKNGSTGVHLFSPFQLRDVTFRNRLFISPMCQYSSIDGYATDWHLVHLGSRAVGGAGAIIAEATAVAPEGRISASDLGLWEDGHIEMLGRIFRFLRDQGAVPGIQLAHAGRKASTAPPWTGGAPILPASGGWEVVAPSAVPFSDRHGLPRALDQEEIGATVEAFRESARRALEAGAQLVEIHAAHGYLIHEFLSPLANRRTDGYGGSFEARIRLLQEVVDAIRTVWPERYPLLVRFSVTDWTEGGWTLEETIETARDLSGRGVDLIDCSSGGVISGVRIPIGPGYQVPLAQQVRERSGVPTGAVGLITEPAQADQIVRLEQADVILMARESLRDPYWPMHAADRLGQEFPPPPQYARAYPT